MRVAIEVDLTRDYGPGATEEEIVKAVCLRLLTGPEDIRLYGLKDREPSTYLINSVVPWGHHHPGE